MLTSTEARLPRAAHTAAAWRIHDIAAGFQVLDVWALPTPGGPDDFPRLVALMNSLDAEQVSPVVRLLFAARWALGRLFGLDEAGDGTDGRVTTLRSRLPDDLLAPSPDDATAGPFAPLYVTDDEAAFEIANRTMHGVLHLGWVADGSGGHRGQMAVLVSPNGALGAGYLSLISPFRHLLVYPAMMRAIGRTWDAESSPVRQIPIPDDVLRMSTLSRVDYADAFEVDAVSDWTAERWARAILEDAPAAMRRSLLTGWTALGLKVGASSGPDAVLGWPVRHSTPEMVLLGAESHVGMPGELLVMLRPGGLLFATFIEHRTVATRAVWAAVERKHVTVVQALLARARQGAGGVMGAGAGAGAGSAGAGLPGEIGTFGPGACSG